MVAAVPGGPSVCTVVVTYNRRALLHECLGALEAQTRRADRVLVVDNASTDGSPEMVREEHPAAELLELETNLGSAGGFAAGMRAAHAGGADWLWLMDDDTIPSPTALEALLAARERLEGFAEPLLLSSRVVWSDGRLHPMNMQVFKRDPAHYLACCERGVLPVRTATWVSLLVHREAVERCGVPLEHFFIWSDDVEYTARLTRHGPTGFAVPASVAEHRTKSAHTAVTESGDRFYFHVRNFTRLLRGDSFGPAEKLSLAWWLTFTTQGYLRANRFGRRSLRHGAARAARWAELEGRHVGEPEPLLGQPAVAAQHPGAVAQAAWRGRHGERAAGGHAGGDEVAVRVAQDPRRPLEIGLGEARAGRPVALDRLAADEQRAPAGEPDRGEPALGGVHDRRAVVQRDPRRRGRLEPAGGVHDPAGEQGGGREVRCADGLEERGQRVRTGDHAARHEPEPRRGDGHLMPPLPLDDQRRGLLADSRLGRRVRRVDDGRHVRRHNAPVSSGGMPRKAASAAT